MITGVSKMNGTHALTSLVVSAVDMMVECAPITWQPLTVTALDTFFKPSVISKWFSTGQWRSEHQSGYQCGGKLIPVCRRGQS